VSDICQGLRTYFAAQADITSAINSTVAGSTTPIYPDILRQGSPLPAIVLNLISSAGQHHMGGSAGFVRSFVQVDVYAATRLQATSVTELLRKAADGKRGTMGSETVSCCHLAARRWLYDLPLDKSDQGRYRLSTDWLIWHRESLPHLGST